VFYAPPGLRYVVDVTLNGLGRVLETLSSQGVRLDVTCRSQITTLAHLSLLTKVSCRHFFCKICKIRASDQYSFDADPDPIWIQGFYDQKLGKIYSLNFLLIKNYNLPIPRPP
jgi:hypothetical protein